MTWAPLLLSFEVAAMATLIAGVAGVALAGVMSRTRFFGADLLEVLITAPMVLPPTVLGYYLLLSVGRNSARPRRRRAAYCRARAAPRQRRGCGLSLSRQSWQSRGQ